MYNYPNCPTQAQSSHFQLEALPKIKKTSDVLVNTKAMACFSILSFKENS
jgi:hypothetical protein